MKCQSSPWCTGASVLLVIGLSVMAALGGCTPAPKSTDSGTAPSANTGAASTPSLLLTSSTYDVALKPNTRLIDAGMMSRAYRGAGSNGELIFDAAKVPEVAALSPGTVVIFAGTALLNVQGVRRTGDTIAVTGVPAGLEDAIDHGRIAWSAALDFRKMVFNPPPGFHRLAAPEARSVALLDALVRPAEAGVSLANNSWTGKAEGFDVTLKLTPNDGNLTIDLQATRSIAGGTISVHGVGKLNGLTNEGSITLADGATTEVTFDNKGLSGSVDFDWKVAFDAEHGGSDPAMAMPVVSNLPFSLDFPVVVGPIPLKVSYKAGYAFQPTFTSKVAVAQGSYHMTFGGDAPMHRSADAESASGAPAPAAPQGDEAGSLSGSGSINSYGGTLSVAAIGLSTTIALPKIEATLGLPSSLNQFLGSPDFGGPFVTLMTQANFLATGTLTIVQCEKRELSIMGFAGYTPGLLGKLKIKPIAPKLIFKKTYTQIEPPNITLCNH